MSKTMGTDSRTSSVILISLIHFLSVPSAICRYLGLTTSFPKDTELSLSEPKLLVFPQVSMAMSLQQMSRIGKQVNV